MKNYYFNNSFFNIDDTLNCGQIFRFSPYKNGFLVYSSDKCCFCFEEDDKVVITCNETDYDYFYYFFDLERDYERIVNMAVNSNYEILNKSAKLGKGIRILNQNNVEMLFSFIISQNNNIPRIKGIIQRLCLAIGEKKEFLGQEYFAFPTIEEISKKPLDFFYEIGLGYRAPYIKRLADNFANGFSLKEFENLSTNVLTEQLMKLYGVGKKVADCVTLFGFHRADSFPVDTWIERVYREDFKGDILDPKKISQWFVAQFGENSGYFQQYLFYYKRSLEKNEK